MSENQSGWQQRIAAMDPWADANRCYLCHFCGAEKTWDDVKEVFVEQPHEPDCLWQNAKDALPPSSSESSVRPMIFDPQHYPEDAAAQKAIEAEMEPHED